MFVIRTRCLPQASFALDKIPDQEDRQIAVLLELTIHERETKKQTENVKTWNSCTLGVLSSERRKSIPRQKPRKG